MLHSIFLGDLSFFLNAFLQAFLTVTLGVSAINSTSAGLTIPPARCLFVKLLSVSISDGDEEVVADK